MGTGLDFAPFMNPKPRFKKGAFPEHSPSFCLVWFRCLAPQHSPHSLQVALGATPCVPATSGSDANTPPHMLASPPGNADVSGVASDTTQKLCDRVAPSLLISLLDNVGHTQKWHECTTRDPELVPFRQVFWIGDLVQGSVQGHSIHELNQLSRSVAIPNCEWSSVWATEWVFYLFIF